MCNCDASDRNRVSQRVLISLSYSVACINHFLLLLPEPLKANMDTYLQALFALAADQSNEVSRAEHDSLHLLPCLRATQPLFVFL